MLSSILTASDVLATYNSETTVAGEVVAKIEALGRSAIAIQASGEDRDAPHRILEAAVQKWGHIDIIVNNAGTGKDQLLEETNDCSLRFPNFPRPSRTFTLQAVSSNRQYLEHDGAYMGTYASSEAALECISKVWAAELGQKYGARMNCVSPGPTADLWLRDTDMEVLKEGDAKIKETPVAARIAQPDDIAQIVVFLCEERSRWTTGSTISASGGLCYV